jgi:hypothetical protein
MRRRSLIPLLLLSTALAPAASATSSTFDFSAPGANQTGAYAAEAGAEVDGGTATLALRGSPAWHDPAWHYRIAVTLTNPEPATRVDHPVRIDLAGAPVTLFEQARLDGSDLLPVLQSTGDPLTVFWVEDLDYVTRSGAIWVRVPGLPPGDTVVVLYFDNPGYAWTSTELAFFADPQGWVTQCVVNPVAASFDLAVQSLVDGNVVTAVGTGVTLGLDAREVGTVPAGSFGPGTCVSGTGAFHATVAGVGADALVPLHLAAREFLHPAMRYEDLYDVLSPFGTATVSVYDNGTLVASTTVTDASPVSLAADVADGHVARITADRPVLVHHRGFNTPTLYSYDAFALVAPETELLGANTGTGYLVASADDTEVDVWYSTGAHETFVLDATEVRTLLSGGSQGSGAAVRIRASAPVMAVTQADGDGGEAVTFLPPRELGLTYALPRAVEYLLVATLDPGVTCEVVDAAGVGITAATSDTIAPAYPNRIRFAGLTAGGELRCDAPVWVAAEDAATNTERNVWPIRSHRPRVEVEPTATVGGVEPQRVADRAAVVTPTLTSPYAVAEWQAFLETATIPAGAAIRYQLSLDTGATWRFWDGEAWAAVSSDDDANAWWDVHLNLADLPVDSDSLTVRAILDGGDGGQTPVLDAVEVYYRLETRATGLAFDAIPSPQALGAPFGITVTAVDDLGRRIQAYAGEAGLQTWQGTVSPASTGPFVNGQVSLSVTVDEAGPAVQLVAFDGLLTGTSAPFEVLALQAAQLEIVSGDGQIGTVGEPLGAPLVIRALSADQAPAAGARVTFTVVGGGGGLTDLQGQGQPTITAAVGADGLAEARLVLGPTPGANRVEVTSDQADVAAVTFVARADEEGAVPPLPDDGGGCGCRASGSADPIAIPLLLLVLLMLGRRNEPWKRS